MAYNYIDTPRTDAGDRTHLTAANISFSEVQGYPSPSKDPSNALVSQLRSQRNGGGALKTPRARNALATLRNGSKGANNNEFTPLLKSAAPHRYREGMSSRRSPRKHSAEEKENGTEELVNSMLAASAYGGPRTPAYLKAGYRETATGRTPGLPVDSSVLHDRDASQIATPALRDAVGSSTLMSTPIPEMPNARDGRGRNEGNALTLREQEAKLEKLDKENFNLKLKIHFLDEALKRTGTDYQQGMIKENTELKMDKTTLTHEIRQQQRSLLRAEKDLEEYRRQLREYAEKVKRRHTDEIIKEELERLREENEENRTLAMRREEEVHELRQRLELVEAGSGEKMQDLKDDVADLEQELRAREAELDGKDDEIEALREKLKSEDDDAATEALRENVAELESELEEKDALVAARDAEIAELKAQARAGVDREKSTRKLRGDVDILEADIREKNSVIDEQHEELRSLQKRLAVAEKDTAVEHQNLKSELRDAQRLAEDKNGEIIALEERLKTARGSWDKEVQTTDARLQEKDEIAQEKEKEVRDLKRTVDEKEDEIKLLMDRLEKSQSAEREALAGVDKQNVSRNVQVLELQEKLRKANEELDIVVDRKNGELDKFRQQARAAEAEAARLKETLSARGSPTKKDAIINEQAERLMTLEQKLKSTTDEKGAEIEELERQLTALEDQMHSQETKLNGRSPSRAQHELVAKMQVELKDLRDEKEGLDDEIIVLENSLDEAQQEKMKLQTTIMDLQKNLLSRGTGANDATPARERSSDIRERVTILEQRCEDYKQQVELLESQLAKAWKQNGGNATPGRERGELRSKLTRAEQQVVDLQVKLAEAEAQARDARDATASGERRDLHNMLRDAQIDVENLQEQLKDQDVRVAALLRKEGETRAQLLQICEERDESAAESAERQARIDNLLKREKDLRTQIQDLKAARYKTEDLETELGQRQGSSSTHARNEAQLRTELRDAKADIGELRRQMQQRDDRLQASINKEQELRDRLRKSREVVDETDFIGQDLQNQIADAEMEIETLRSQLRDRERKLQTSLTRETELRSRLKNTGSGKTHSKALEVAEKTHEKELRGLSKQIQFLSAKCKREQSFRQDLVFVKKWFTLQVEMYGACNQADLKMLEEMGITPDLQVRQKRPSLKAAGLAVVATLRMKKMQMEWKGNQKLHESLMRKLEGMKKGAAGGMAV